MTPERWQKAKELCHLALDREPQQQAAFLAAACADDETLRREVESLIARMTGEGILDAPIFEKLGIDAAVVGAPDGAKRSLPAMLGRYRMLRLVGEGGMGVVYEAEQDQPRRMVALKVIKPGLMNPELLRRFERESQILARLQHPGIAQIYEAGTADAGFGPQPYFAMEFIHGAPLGEYAESHHLGARQRLELMAKVCDAVEHAHQRGIIHRDLKPGNILVEESGQPKILDFGVARVTDGDAQATRQTDLGQLIGTLAYMSPEQVLADPLELDTRSDVYALGVILYELLAKRLPYEVRRNPNEAIRAIREEDPSRLSAISRDYRGDVETIVAKALEKERARRYSSSAALAADIRRHLADEPITARPASTAYQLRKFARRHRALVAAAATLGVVLVAGAVVSTREAVRARRAEQTAQAVNDFLRNDLLAQASAENQSGPNTRPDPHLEVRTALDRAAARIAGKFRNDPEVEAAIRDTIGQTYMDLGLFPQSRTQLERALQLERSALGETDPKTVNTLSRLGRTVYLQGKYPEAQALFNQALGLQRRVLGPEHPDTLTTMNGLGAVALAQGKFAQAEEFNSKILEIRRRVLGAEHPSTLASMNNLAVAYERQQKYAQAEELDRKTLEIMSRTLGPEHPRTLVSMISLGIVYLEQGKYVQAEAMLSRDLEIQRRVLGPEHITTLVSMSNLANAYHSQGKYTQAAVLSLETLEIRRRVLGAEHANTLVSMDNLAEAYTMLGKYAQAETLLQQALEAGRRVLGPDHGLTLLLLADSASLYQREGKYRLAESNAVQALADYRRVQGAEHPDTMAAVAQLALAYLSQGKFGQAEPLARQAVEFHRRKQPEDWQRFRAESLLGASLSGEKRYAEAELLLVEGYQGMAARKERIDVPDWYHLDRAREWLVQLYGAWGKPDQAARWRAGQ